MRTALSAQFWSGPSLFVVKLETALIRSINVDWPIFYCSNISEFPPRAQFIQFTANGYT